MPHVMTAGQWEHSEGAPESNVGARLDLLPYLDCKRFSVRNCGSLPRALTHRIDVGSRGLVVDASSSLYLLNGRTGTSKHSKSESVLSEDVSPETLETGTH